MGVIGQRGMVIDPDGNVRLQEWTNSHGLRVLPFVRPLFGVNDRDEPQLVGSCVLASIGGRTLLLTAAHVYDENEFSSFYIGNGQKLVLLESDTVCATVRRSGTRHKDKLDLAVIPPLDRTVGDLHQFRFLTPEQFDVGSGTVVRRYIALGYPETRNRPLYRRKVVASEATAYSAVPADEAVYPRCGFTETAHILIKFTRQRIVGDGGQIVTAPAPHGMSGGGLWHFEQAEEGEESAPLLAGILTENPRNESVMAATRVFLVLHMIGERFPELKAHLPDLPPVRIRAT
jgi:hypothetical protein